MGRDHRGRFGGTRETRVGTPRSPSWPPSFARATLFVGSDTGPLHIAAAVGTPCVGLYGPMPATRTGPYGPSHVAIQKLAFEGSSRERRNAAPRADGGDHGRGRRRGLRSNSAKSGLERGVGRVYAGWAERSESHQKLLMSWWDYMSRVTRPASSRRRDTGSASHRCTSSSADRPSGLCGRRKCRRATRPRNWIDPCAAGGARHRAILGLPAMRRLGVFANGLLPHVINPQGQDRKPVDRAAGRLRVQSRRWLWLRALLAKLLDQKVIQLFDAVVALLVEFVDPPFHLG